MYRPRNEFGVTLGKLVFGQSGGVSSRAVSDELDTENLYVEISLLGSYSATKTVALSAGATITFSEVPVDSRIYAKAEVYELEDEEKEILYTGESEEISVAEGENTLTLKMKKAISESYIGSKAPNKAKAVGDIVFTDGSATPYSEGLELTDEQKDAAVAVIFYVGTGCSNNGENRTLGVGLHKSSEKYAWATGKIEFTGLEIALSGKTAAESTENGNELQTANKAGTWDIDTSTFVDGSKGWDVICGVDENASSTAETNYPAFHWCNTYGSTYSLSGYANGWYMPTLAEFSMMYRVIDNLDSAILCAGGDKLLTDDDTHYLTSNQFPGWNHELAYTFSFKDARAYFYYDLPNYVRAVRAF